MRAAGAAVCLALLAVVAVGLAWVGGGPTPLAESAVNPQTGAVPQKKTLEISSTVFTAFGESGLEPGQFYQPRGITGLPDGSFAVVDRKARVQIYNAQLEPVGLWPMAENARGNPKGLCGMPDGTLLVCDTHYGRLMRMTIDGKLIKQWGQPGTEPGEFIHPLSAAVDAKRQVVYVCEYGAKNDRVQKFTLDGTFIKAWGRFGTENGEMTRPSGVAVDPDGNVWIADAVNHRIQKFDPEGAFLGAFGEMGSEPGQLRYPYDIACDSAGKVYVAEYNNHRVSVFDLQGHFLKTLGEPGSEVGQFKWPWSLAVDARGRLLVSDTGNDRIQVLQVAPPPTAVTP